MVWRKIIRLCFFLSLSAILTFSTVLRTERDSNKLIDNDDVLNLLTELDHNCSCVYYYQCDEDGFIIKDGHSLINERGKSNDTSRILCKGGDFIGNFVCCKHKPTEVDNPEENTTPTIEIIDPTLLKQPKPRRCGTQLPKFDVRIFADEDELSAVNGEFPWIAAIYKKVSGPKEWQFRSSGSLIHPQVVLTANHAVRTSKAPELRVLVNSDIELQTIGGVNATVFEREVQEIIKHPNFSSGTLANDIALLFLKEPYDVSSKKHTINTICLRPNSTDENKRCLVAGWGKTTAEDENSKFLKKVELPIVPHSKCQEMLRKTRLGEKFTLDKSFMCAGGEEGKDACKGDGGSPLMCLSESGRMYQAGIVAWGVGCGKADVPGVYADVSVLHNWIIEQLDARNIIF